MQTYLVVFYSGAFSIRTTRTGHEFHRKSDQ